MLKMYTQYSRTKYSSVCYFYKCSKCGAMNQGQIVVDASASYNDRGVYTSKGLDKRKQSSDKNAIAKLEKKKKKVMEKIRQKNYRYLNLSSSCRKCGNREEWAGPGFVLPKWLDILQAIAMIPVIPPIILLTWYLFDAHTGINAYLGTGLYLLTFVCLLIIPHLLYRKKYHEAEARFIGLPEASLPHAFFGDSLSAFDTAKKYYMEQNWSSEEEFDELKQSASQPNAAAEMIAQIFQNKKLKH